MHAWEAIQKTLDHIENHIGEEIQIEALAKIAVLSLFYYQRLFTRLVKMPVREYIKLRRLAKACEMLRDKKQRILDIAVEYGFGSHETFTRAFKNAYGITPAQYRDNPVGLQGVEKPDLLLHYIMVDEGVPLISDGLVLEINRRYLQEPINFLGLQAVIPFVGGKMLGEKTGINIAGEIWGRLFKTLHNIPHISSGRLLGVSYHGNAPDGYTTYFAGAETQRDDPRFASWQLPVREYAVCGFEAETQEQLSMSLGKAMIFTRFWLKKHGLIADGFFPELYYQTANDAYMELWIPFKRREQ